MRTTEGGAGRNVRNSMQRTKESLVQMSGCLKKKQDNRQTKNNTAESRPCSQAVVKTNRTQEQVAKAFTIMNILG